MAVFNVVALLPLLAMTTLGLLVANVECLTISISPGDVGGRTRRRMPGIRGPDRHVPAALAGPRSPPPVRRPMGWSVLNRLVEAHDATTVMPSVTTASSTTPSPFATINGSANGTIVTPLNETSGVLEVVLRGYDWAYFSFPAPMPDNSAVEIMATLTNCDLDVSTTRVFASLEAFLPPLQPAYGDDAAIQDDSSDSDVLSVFSPAVQQNMLCTLDPGVGISIKHTNGTVNASQWYVLLQQTGVKLANHTSSKECHIQLYWNAVPASSIVRHMSVQALLLVLFFIGLSLSYLPIILHRNFVGFRASTRTSLAAFIFVPVAFITWCLGRLGQAALRWVTEFIHTRDRVKRHALRREAASRTKPQVAAPSVTPPTSQPLPRQAIEPAESGGGRGGLRDDRELTELGTVASPGPAPSDRRSPPSGGTAPPIPRAAPPAAQEDDEDEQVCRICRDGDLDEDLVTACRCEGSVKWIHPSCLNRWRVAAVQQNPRYVHVCEICHSPFTVAVDRPSLWWAVGRRALFYLTLVFVAYMIMCLTGAATRLVVGPMACSASFHGVDMNAPFGLRGLVVGWAAYFAYATMAFVATHVAWVIHRTMQRPEAPTPPLSTVFFCDAMSTCAFVIAYVWQIVVLMLLSLAGKAIFYHASERFVWTDEVSLTMGFILVLLLGTLLVVILGLRMLFLAACPEVLVAMRLATSESIAAVRGRPVAGESATGRRRTQAADEGTEALTGAVTEGTEAEGAAQDAAGLAQPRVSASRPGAPAPAASLAPLHGVAVSITGRAQGGGDQPATAAVEPA